MVAKQIISFQDLTVSRKTTNCYDASDFLRLVKQLAKHSLLGSSNSPDEDLRLTSVRIVAREQGRLSEIGIGGQGGLGHIPARPCGGPPGHQGPRPAKPEGERVVQEDPIRKRKWSR